MTLLLFLYVLLFFSFLYISMQIHIISKKRKNKKKHIRFVKMRMVLCVAMLACVFINRFALNNPNVKEGNIFAFLLMIICVIGVFMSDAKIVKEISEDEDMVFLESSINNIESKMAKQRKSLKNKNRLDEALNSDGGREV